MSKFNLDEYETVKERKQRFYKDFSDGRIVVRSVSDDNLDYAMFEARVYLSAEDQEKDIPRGTGYALEIRDKELKTSRSGKEYESVNYSSWTENCEESAVGRALDNAGYASNGKPSREEMQKSERMSKTISKNKKVTVNKKDAELVEAVLDIDRNDFTEDVAKKLKQYGKLTEGQRNKFQEILDEKWKEGNEDIEPDEPPFNL